MHRQIEFGELDIFLGAGFVIAVRHGAAGDAIRARMRAEQHPELLKTGPAAVVWSILDDVIDDYVPVVDAMESEIEEVEQAIFAGRSRLDRTDLLISRPSSTSCTEPCTRS